MTTSTRSQYNWSLFSVQHLITIRKLIMFVSVVVVVVVVDVQANVAQTTESAYVYKLSQQQQQQQTSYNETTSTTNDLKSVPKFKRHSSDTSTTTTTVHVRIGVLLEESNHELANMFIRTIKMINEQKDETIRQLLGALLAQRRKAASSSVLPATSSSASSAFLSMVASDAEERGAQFGTVVASEPPLTSSNITQQSQSTVKRGDRHRVFVRHTHTTTNNDKQIELANNNNNLCTLNCTTTTTTTTMCSQHNNDELAKSKSARQTCAKQTTRKNRRALLQQQEQQAFNSNDHDDDDDSTSQMMSLRLEPMIEFLTDRQSALEADEKVCQLVESGVRAIFGPCDGHSIQHVQSICDTLEIPYFELRPFLGSANAISQQHFASASLVPSPSSSSPSLSSFHHQSTLSKTQQTASMLLSSSSSSTNKPEDLTVNLYPPSHLLNSAYIDLIHALNWSSFAIVYEDGQSMIKLQNIFKEATTSGSWTNKWRIKLFRYDEEPSSQSESLLFDTFSSDKSKRTSTKQQLLSNQQEQSADASIDKQTQVSTATTTTTTNQATNEHNNDEKIHKRTPVSTRQKYSSDTTTFRDVFWRVKMSGEHNILLDVKTENLYEALKQAQQVGCVTEEFSYLITSLDLHMIDLEDFKYSRTRIMGLSLIEVTKDVTTSAIDNKPLFSESYLEHLGMQNLIQQRDSSPTRLLRAGRVSSSSSNSQRNNWLNHSMNEAESNDQARRELLQSSPASLSLLPTVDRNNEQRLFDFFLEHQERDLSRARLSTSSALLHDSLLLLTLGLKQLDPVGQYLHHTPPPIYCSPDSTPWPHGSSLVNYMKQTTFTGLTGRITFDQRGLRNNFKLNVMGVAPNIRLVKVGEWHSSQASGGGGDLSKLVKNVMMQQTTNGDLSKSNNNNNNNNDHDDDTTTIGDDFNSYDELSSRYEHELRSYRRLVAAGKQIQVPYTKRASPSGALQVNEIIFERLYREQADKIDTLVVTAKLSQPYFMLKETPDKLHGNDQFEGYAVDLIHELSKLVNFKYKWREVADKKYGSKEVLENGSIVWNGMIGEIVRGQADLAIVDLTITAQREEAVDFTLPFMNTGISILFKKPTTKVTTLFSFLSPFSSDVWAYVLAAYCGISAILFLVGHLSPYEWADPHPCRHMKSSIDHDDNSGSVAVVDDDDEDDNDNNLNNYNNRYQPSPLTRTTVLRNQFSLLNSFWFTIGSLMQQGSDLTPRSMSTRTIAGIWYFFTLIMISSYTANLAAFLTVEKVVYPIENVRDLSNQQEIRYGCVESGSTCLFFQDSQIDTYKKIDETMRKHRTYVRSNDEGQKRVGEGKFAFFMESTTIEYIIERNCNLTQIGGLMDSKGYGLATSKKSRHKRPYRTLLNEGILHLQETGMLHVLKNRWWKEKRGGGTCIDDAKGGGVTELSLANVGGVFVVLLGGLGISFLVAIAEFMWRARRSGSSRDRMCEEMINDLKFALACKSSTKPVTKALRQQQQQKQQHSIEAASSQQKRHLYYSNGGDINNTRQHDQVAKFGHDTKAMKRLTNGSANQKQDCNPILLHAMLTMLTQQQQQVQVGEHLEPRTDKQSRFFQSPN